MNQPSNNDNSWKNEPGVQDATYQDFVAPMVAGLGGIPRIVAAAKAALSAAPAISAGLGTAVPVVKRMTEANVDLGDVGGSEASSIDSISKILTNWADIAQQAGDFARMNAYKMLQSALTQFQISPDQIMKKAWLIHADPNNL
jgi:hypothetical protein